MNTTEAALRAALEEFCECIDVTGGVYYTAGGLACPQGDDEWVDLGEAYLGACAALGRPPVIDEDLTEDDLDD